MSDVIERVRLSRTTLWRLTRAGEFPEPIRFANGRVCYRLDPVEEWMHAQVAHAARSGALRDDEPSNKQCSRLKLLRHTDLRSR